MSQLLINEYLRELAEIRKVSGSKNEGAVSEAFKDLLKRWGRQHKLHFSAQYEMKGVMKNHIRPDGALLHELRMPLGFWEAKDQKDDLDAEIQKKFRAGYPKTNIIFSNDDTFVLIQNGEEAIRCGAEDTESLERLLKRFFAFERPEIEGFRTAVEQFKTDLPAVLEALRKMIEREHTSNKLFSAAETKFLAHA